VGDAPLLRARRARGGTLVFVSHHSGRCICGCGRRGVQLHHVVYAQHLSKGDGSRKDKRNLVPVHFECHAAHHGRSRPFSLHVLPTAVFEFAAEVLGAERAYEYLKRRYSGSDMRHERLLLGTDTMRHATPLDPVGHMQARQAAR
jgi:hypothetical protein